MDNGGTEASNFLFQLEVALHGETGLSSYSP